MSPAISVLLLCCLGLASSLPSTARAETSHRSEPERTGENGLLRLKPRQAPVWGNHGLFSHAPLASLKLSPPSARSFRDLPDYASAFAPSRLKAARVTSWTLPDADKAALELAINLGNLESICDSRRTGGGAAELAGCTVTTPAQTTEEGPDVADHAHGRDLLADLGVSAGSVTPTLLRYSDEETNVSLLISPGGPCTGACLKLAGSF